MAPLNRRELLCRSAAVAIGSLSFPIAAEPAPAANRTTKRVIVVGGGIGGLCCAYELMERGHDVTVLEASGRTGGHVKTIHDPLPDGLYADVGAEHFTRPGYEMYWKYVEKFKLPALAYPRRINMLRRIKGKWYTEEQLQDPAILRALEYSQPEIDYIVKHGWTELPRFYYGPYLDAIEDEYQPFGVGLDELDQITVSDLLQQIKASGTALRAAEVKRGDGSRAAKANEVSALFHIWQLAIQKRRGLPAFKREVFRLRGGNQLMTDTFTARLGDRVRLGCPVTEIERGETGVTAHFREFGEPQKLDADYLVMSLTPAHLQKIPVKPAWPVEKAFALESTRYSSQARVVLQSRTPFWKGEFASINLEFSDPTLHQVYETADEVPGQRCVLMGSAEAEVTADESLATFNKLYPGKSHTIERALVHNWSHDPWSSGCERLPFPLGQLKKIWPQLLGPVGRIHFAGSFADNLPWGMDAATRSANRVAEKIDAA